MSQTSTLDMDVDSPPPGAGPFYEVIDGTVVEPPEMSAFETVFATQISQAITLFYAQAGLPGRLAAETIFRLGTGLQRRPDLAFVSYERWARRRPVSKTASWQVVPDLAVEVISPNDHAIAVLEKLDHYFRAGVRQVWVMYPQHGRVFVHDGPKSITVLDATDTLDGGDVLPGFRLRLADLFEEADEAED